MTGSIDPASACPLRLTADGVTAAWLSAGLRTRRPGVVVSDDFYRRAFGAVELFRIAHPDGRVLHAELSICGSDVMIGDPDNRRAAGTRALHGRAPHLRRR